MMDSTWLRTSLEEGSSVKKPKRQMDSQYIKDKALLLKLKKKEMTSREQAYWLPANEIASNASNHATPVTPFVHNRPPQVKILANLQRKRISALNLCLLPIIDVPPSFEIALRKNLRSACDREHTKVLELEAEVLKQQKMVIESEKRTFCCGERATYVS
ncbi:hypothetical protein Tco_0247202 [Tanacetum coccineum]